MSVMSSSHLPDGYLQAAADQVLKDTLRKRLQEVADKVLDDVVDTLVAELETRTEQNFMMDRMKHEVIYRIDDRRKKEHP